MSVLWNVSDSTLAEQLAKWLAFIAPGPNWKVDLFKNDFTPGPGTVFGDFVLSDFPGYAQKTFDPSTFSAPVVLDNVAVTELAAPVEFARDGSAGAAQTAYGYVVRDYLGFYRFAERFGVPREMSGSASVSILIRLRHGVASE